MTNSMPPPPETPPTVPPPLTEPGDIPHQKHGPGPLAAGLIGLTLGAGIVGAAWTITANSDPGKPATFTLEGEFTLLEDAVDIDDSCAGTGGYDDIAEGTSVTVYGAKGDVIATGSLGKSSSAAFGTCTFDIAVADVPKGEKFYKVEVSHRGTLQLSAEQAENGELASTLG
ncbi:hypothetical protein [Streptomyces sp. NPDC058653]|uniref:hypothetical protein n=1 Tax=Streptomyces sp. NPDC058653 TaxID=3346576 RepID=UPI0036678165